MTVDSDGAWVGLGSRFNSGWPWLEESWGLDPMYGTSGWCRSCGTPLGQQTGSLVVQSSKFPRAPVWMTNWRFDVLCVAGEVADLMKTHFDVELREVYKPRGGPTGVMQLMPRIEDRPWYDEAELSRAVIARHREFEGERTGARCRECDIWRWLPILAGEAPIDQAALSGGGPVLASKECFGDGHQSFRHLVFCRDLAEFLVAAHPKVWRLRNIQVGAN